MQSRNSPTQSLGEIDLSSPLEAQLKQWKESVKAKLIQRGLLDRLTTDVSHILERTNMIHPDTPTDTNSTYMLYRQLFSEIQSTVHPSLSKEIVQFIENDDRLKTDITSTCVDYLDNHKEKYVLDSEPNTIKRKMDNIESIVNENKKEKKQKRKREGDALTEEEPFIICGIVNSRGRPCLRRQKTCPYHSKTRGLLK